MSDDDDVMAVMVWSGRELWALGGECASDLKCSLVPSIVPPLPAEKCEEIDGRPNWATSSAIWNNASLTQPSFNKYPNSDSEQNGELSCRGVEVLHRIWPPLHSPLKTRSPLQANCRIE